MALQKIERIEWRVFCDRMSKSLLGKWAEIEIASAQTGVHLEARWLPAIGVTYDPNDDVVAILLDGLDHRISHPRELYAEIGIQGLESLGILDENRTWQILVLREPLMLPAPRDR
jgi:hypothetical protein